MFSYLRKNNNKNIFFNLLMIISLTTLFISVINGFAPIPSDYPQFNVFVNNNEIDMQQNSQNIISISVINVDKLLTRYTITSNTIDGIDFYINNTLTTDESFYRNIKLNVNHINPGTYYLIINVIGERNYKISQKQVIVKLNIYTQQNSLYYTNPNINLIPHINIIDFDKRNFVLNNHGDYFSIKLINTGADSDFKIKYFPTDINIIFDQNRYAIKNNQEKIIFGNILYDNSLNKNLNNNFYSIRLYAEENYSKQQFDLGYINIYINKDVAIIPEKNNDDFNNIIQTMTANVIVNNDTNNITNNPLINNTENNITGLFGLNNNYGTILEILLIIGIIYLIYYLLVKSRIFGNSINAKSFISK